MNNARSTSGNDKVAVDCSTTKDFVGRGPGEAGISGQILCENPGGISNSPLLLGIT